MSATVGGVSYLKCVCRKVQPSMGEGGASMDHWCIVSFVARQLVVLMMGSLLQMNSSRGEYVFS
jgi:hypothetical protein